MSDSAGTTNLGDLELARAGIQQREIDSESSGGHPVLTADGAGGVAWQPAVGGGGKEYVALLAQSDEDAPVVTVLENTLGGTIVWTRLGYASYRATLTRAFPGRQDADQNRAGTQEQRLLVGGCAADKRAEFLVYTTDNSGSLLEGFQELQVEIDVYP